VQTAVFGNGPLGVERMENLLIDPGTANISSLWTDIRGLGRTCQRVIARRETLAGLSQTNKSLRILHPALYLNIRFIFDCSDNTSRFLSRAGSFCGSTSATQSSTFQPGTGVWHPLLGTNWARSTSFINLELQVWHPPIG